MLELFASPETWIALMTLIALEIVFRIDNIIFYLRFGWQLAALAKGASAPLGNRTRSDHASMSTVCIELVNWPSDNIAYIIW
jgi:hypothetical protein